MVRSKGLALFPALCLVLSACDSGTGPCCGAARFRIRESATSAVFHVEITSASVVAEAEALRASQEARWVIGRPRNGDGGFNAPWTWSLDPATISFAEVTIEACQSTAAMVEDDLPYWIQFGQLCLFGVVEARVGP
ncbi:MAG: BP74-related protein [Gemmatimonadales bacterium]